MAVAIGTAKERERALNSGADITVINRENVPWLVSRQLKLKQWPWDMVVVDESSSFKSPSAQRFRALKRVRKHIDRVVLLTATPAPNSLLELWAQVWLLDRGEALGSTFTGFKSMYFDQDYFGFAWTLRRGSAEKIHRAVEPYCLAMRAQDYLDLPPKLERTHYAVLPHYAVEAYAALERDLLAEINGQEITAVNAGVLDGKLQQAAQGAIYDDERQVVALHEVKLEVLEDLIESAQEPVLVVYTYQHDFLRIKKRFPAAINVREPGAIDRWNRGKASIMCCHPASAGHGLNLQAGGCQMIWFGLTWSGELDAQMIGRLHRQGQTRPVVVHRIVAQGTIDEDILLAVRGKAVGQDGLVNAIRRRVGANR
jgi:SNF2 family DNA or RNA helicase